MHTLMRIEQLAVFLSGFGVSITILLIVGSILRKRYFVMTSSAGDKWSATSASDDFSYITKEVYVACLFKDQTCYKCGDDNAAEPLSSFIKKEIWRAGRFMFWSTWNMRSYNR